MPFTLAHPAAILPFRRFCPRSLSFPALVVGSVAPDVGYWSGPLVLQRISHGFWGSFWFDLPIGLLMLVVIYLLRAPVAERLPTSSRDLFLAMWPRPLGTPLAVVVSLMIGIWTHLLWDTFTHNHGWLVERVAALRTPLFDFRGKAFRVSHLISYLCSFGGVAVLLAAIISWRENSSYGSRSFSQAERWKLILIAGLILPITAIHHLAPSLAGLCVVAVLSFLMIVATWRIIAGPAQTARRDR